MPTARPACETCPTRAAGVFCDLSPDDLRAVSGRRSFNTYPRRSVIFYQGNPPLGLYCIQEGTVKITKHGEDGQVAIVRLAGPGSLLGYRALFAGEAYAATAEVIEDAALCFIDQATIGDLLRRHALLALGILGRVCRDLRVAEDAALDLVRLPVPGRVARMLQALQASHGRPCPDGIELRIGLTREEMATLVGTTPETLIRTLSDFKARGLVALTPPHAIVIRKPADLARLAAA